MTSPTDNMTPRRPWRMMLLATIGTLLIGGVLAYRFAIRSLEERIVAALGPRGEVREVRVGFTGIEMSGLRIRAPSSAGKEAAWPAEDELRVERLLISPSFADLLRMRIVMNTVRIDGAYLSILRSRDGKVKIVPSLLSGPSETTRDAPAGIGNESSTERGTTSESPQATTPVTINGVELHNGVVEFFDGTLRKSLVKQRIEAIEAQIGQIKIPDLTGQTPIRIKATHQGVRANGEISVDGSIELATRESGITTLLNGVDMVSLQPYLIKANETGVSKGTLDFELNSSIKKGMLYAPGSLVLSDLELAASSASVMGIPRKLAVKMMKSKKGKISINFVLTGDFNDPTYSLNENLSTRIAASVAGKLGVDLEGLVKGVEGLGSDTAKGVVKSLGIPKKK